MSMGDSGMSRGTVECKLLRREQWNSSHASRRNWDAVMLVEGNIPNPQEVHLHVGADSDQIVLY